MTDALELLSGDAQTFVEKIWASHVHLHQADPADLVGLLSFDDVDELLTSTAIRTPAVRLAQDGSVLPQSRYTRSGATLAGQPLTGLVDARKVIDLFEGGATVVLQGLHRYWPPLTRLVAELELALGHPCQANAYLTPPGSQGFAVHSDSHDVFVFQTHGAKLWEVHPAPGESAEVREVLLEPGLSMYLPTGTPHAARARDTVSLHVTIGINQVTWRTLLDRAVDQAMEQVERRRPPAGRLPRGSRRCSPTGSTTGCGRCATRWPPPTWRAWPTTRPGRSWRSATPTCAAPWSTGWTSTRSPPTPRCVAARASRACCVPTATGCTCCSATGG